MSKDKYRPSTADFEVTETSGTFEIPSGIGGGGAAARPTPSTSTPGAPPPPPPFGDETRENWYPTGIRVAKQDIFYHNDGRMRVNVTLQWNNLSGADTYFVRVTPATAVQGGPV